MRIQQLVAAAAVLSAFGCAERPAPPPAGADTLPSIIDSYLDGFARRHPSIAAGNGQPLNGAPLRKAPGFLASTGT